MHYHASAINFLAWGTKEWIIIPPKGALYSTVPALQYFEEGFLADGPDSVPDGTQVCQQQAGDIFIVPDNIGHATLNTEITIGTAFEVRYWPTFAGGLDNGMVNFFFQETQRQKRSQHSSWR